MKLISKNILVTGGLGAIGSNLVNRLSQHNNVIILDNLTSGELTNVNQNENVVLYKNDIRDLEILNHIFSKFAINYVFHLAANFANQNSVENPLLDCDVNAKGTLQLLKTANFSSLERFIYASSSGVYGSTNLPMTEDIIGQLETPYYIHKLLGEQYCNYFYEQYGTKIVNVRIFNSYGPGELDGRYRNVIPNFFVKAIKGKNLVITGTGYETRDFTYVDDIVDGLVLMATENSAIGKTINLGSGLSTTILEIANNIIKITKSPSKILFQAPRNWDKVQHRKAIIKQAQVILGWDPKIDIERGLNYYYLWLLEKLKK